MEENKESEYKTVIQISLNKEGHKKLDVGTVAKEVLIDLLADSLKIIAMKKDNVVNVPAGMSAGGIRNWINRKKKK